MLRWLLEAIARLPSLIRMGRTADIVYVNSFVLVPAALAARLAHRTVVWHLHEIPPASRVAGRIVRLLSTRQICVSHAVAAALGLSTSTRCVVLHNAVDLPRATVSQPPATIDCPLEVGIVARINQGKGHLVLADAFMELLSEDQPIRLHIVGGPHSSDTTVASELERRLSSVPRERIVWAGDVPSGSEYMRALHVLAAPSVRPDPFPLSVLEGMAAGLVVVASDAGGHPEAIQDNRTGLLCAPGDSHQLAAKIRGLVTDLPRRVALSAAARTFVTAEMSPEAFREGLRGAIDDV
jgi:glycosyltransferase involved in cell wall biosynthesis